LSLVGHDYDGHELSLELRQRGQLKDVVGKWLRRVRGIETEEERLERERGRVTMLEVGTKVGVYYDRYHLGEVKEVDVKIGKMLVRYKGAGDEYWEDYPPKVEDDIRVITEEMFEEGVKMIREGEDGYEKWLKENE